MIEKHIEVLDVCELKLIKCFVISFIFLFISEFIQWFSIFLWILNGYVIYHLTKVWKSHRYTEAEKNRIDRKIEFLNLK